MQRLGPRGAASRHASGRVGGEGKSFVQFCTKLSGHKFPGRSPLVRRKVRQNCLTFPGHPRARKPTLSGRLSLFVHLLSVGSSIYPSTAVPPATGRLSGVPPIDP